MKILALSDVELKRIHHPSFRDRYSSVDMIISCGDLPIAYLEFVMSAINRNLYYVNGNHDFGDYRANMPGINLHNRTETTQRGIILAGIEGSGWYNGEPGQYSQNEMWTIALQLVPKLLANKARHKRYLDIFVSHAPPWGIHDREDLPHQGIKAFRWLIRNFKPKLHMHGHTHLYSSSEAYITTFHQTSVINCYGFQEIETSFSSRQLSPKKEAIYE